MRNKYKLLGILYISFSLLFLSASFSNNDHRKSADTVIIPLYLTKEHTVSVIPIETYVMHVLSCEMPSSFHIEALKAQAVAVRTYAVARLQKHKNPEQHPLAPLCDSTHCQVYNNSTDIAEKIKKAVRETESEMIYYQGQVIDNALYHSSSGGQTENSEDVFVSAVPYLKSVDSPYENGSPRNGHGVGMSQHGANGMALRGYDYKKILSHYYSGTVVH